MDSKLFLTILNMSLTGAFVIIAICLARLSLKKAPKIISYCLWAVAGFRLVFPFSIKSVFSLIPFKAQTIPLDIAMQPVPRIDSGITIIDDIISNSLPAPIPIASINPLQIFTLIGTFVWFIGVTTMLLYGVVSIIILKIKMRHVTYVEANVCEAENIKSPFVLGVFAPKIYLPFGLSEQEQGYIILHEQTHIRRHDNIVKFVAYFILCLHWFNPLVWVAFLLMGVDMEMSCDEHVLKEMGTNIKKKEYSMSLISLSLDRRIIGGSPLAFSEGGMKERVKNVLKFKKTSRVIVILAVAFAAVLSMGFATNKKEVVTLIPENETSAIEELSELIYAGSIDRVKGYVYAKDLLEALLKTKESKDGNLVSFPLYKEDGKTVIGSIGSCFELISEAIRNEYMTMSLDYPINEYGMTYGSDANAILYGAESDLIAAMGIDGTIGYVYNTDLNKEQPENPQEAVEYMRRLDERYEEMKITNEKYVRMIPLYAEDGRTVIGEYGIGGGPEF